MQTFDITDFGAIGDGKTLNTSALQQASEACRKAGGGVLRVPPGVFMTGVFELFSGTTLLVEKDGRLLGSPRLEDHMVGTASVGLIYAQNARDLLFTGEGVLDGNASIFFDPTFLNGGNDDFSMCDTWQKRHGLPYGNKDLNHGPIGWKARPGNMIILAQCTGVRMDKLTVTGAAYWTLHLADCEDVTIENLRIDNDPTHPNNDGIHFTTCRNVRVRNCHISSGDDAIAITGFRDPGGETQIAFGLRGIVGVAEDIEVSDCFLSSRSAGVRIGYGQNPVRKVRLARLDIQGSNRGIGIFARQADVENIVVENCRIETSLFNGNWWGRGEPIQVSAVRFPGEKELFHVRHIVFRDIEATGENAVTFFAEEPGAIDDVELVRVNATLRRGPLFEAWGGNLDLRPAAAHLQIIAGGNAPLWSAGATHLRCENCRWTLDANAGPEFFARAGRA